MTKSHRESVRSGVAKRSGSASGTMSKNIITNDDLVLPKKKTLVGGKFAAFSVGD